MILQYIFLITEWNEYSNMISDIQGYKYNFYKNLENNFNFKNIIIFIFGYILFVYGIYYYYYTIFSKKSLFEGFKFIVVLYLLWDVCLFTMFDKGVKYYPLLFYDVFVVGGVCMFISQVILQNYFDILQKYIPLLVILYFSTMIWFFYENYKYNPDLSNVKGIVLF
jgi:hypothetical protein